MFKFSNFDFFFQTTSDVDVIYTKVVALNMFYIFVADNIF